MELSTRTSMQYWQSSLTSCPGLTYFRWEMASMSLRDSETRTTLSSEIASTARN